jgi:regulator of sigma E protease
LDSLISLVFWVNVLKVALGLGFVIFIHELGHFLMAKWNGVKVERFSIGFGPALLKYTRGETEYVLAAIPLGGYVKMLGEGLESEASQTLDPRAFPNKSVGARMAIISAGVIMNLFSGWLCFVYAHSQGMEEIPAEAGAMVPGSPAYEAGLRPGDRIVAIDGRRDITFNTLKLKVSLSGAGQTLRFDVERPGQKDLLTFEIEPRREGSAEMPGIGIAPRSSLTLINADPPFEPLAGMTLGDSPPELDLKPGDTLVAAGVVGQPHEPIPDIESWHRFLARHSDHRIEIEVERKSSMANSTTERKTSTLPANHRVDFGFRLEIEPIAALRKGSPAEQAGFRKGDKIVKVDGDADFDPMQLPDKCYKKAGQAMTFEVQRPGGGAEPRLVRLTATPDDSPPWTDDVPAEGRPLNVAGLGLAYPVRSRIVAIKPNTPAARAGLKVGDVITAMNLHPPDEEDAAPAATAAKEKKGTSKSTSTSKETFTFSDTDLGWPSAFAMLQRLPWSKIELVINNAKTPIVVNPEPASEEWYYPLRGLQFQPHFTVLKAENATAALRMGFDDTIDNVLSIYAMFRSLWQQRVSPKNLGGPILIAQVAYNRASAGIVELIYFLGLLSINLAVLNFLPIPPLDGGHMLFLSAEKIRGRPLPESAMIAGTYLGLLFVVFLMVFVMFQDVARLQFVRNIARLFTG